MSFVFTMSYSTCLLGIATFWTGVPLRGFIIPFTIRNFLTWQITLFCTISSSLVCVAVLGSGFNSSWLLTAVCIFFGRFLLFVLFWFKQSIIFVYSLLVVVLFWFFFIFFLFSLSAYFFFFLDFWPIVLVVWFVWKLIVLLLSSFHSLDFHLLQKSSNFPMKFVLYAILIFTLIHSSDEVFLIRFVYCIICGIFVLIGSS